MMSIVIDIFSLSGYICRKVICGVSRTGFLIFRTEVPFQWFPFWLLQVGRASPSLLKNFIPMADRHDTAAMVQQKPEFCRNMTGDSNLKISVGEAEPEQVSSSFIVTEQHSSQPGIFVKLQQPCTHGIQSVDTFTVDNYFGFDEESEDDLRLSLSPVKMATSLKPVVSVPFAVSSTPNLKPSFTRPHAKPFRLVNKGPKTETTLMSKPAVSEMPVASDAVRGAHNSSTSVLFMDENVPMQHFVKVSVPHVIVVSFTRFHILESWSMRLVFGP